MSGEFDDAIPEDAWRWEVPDLSVVTIMLPDNILMQINERVRQLDINTPLEYLRLLVAMDLGGVITQDMWDKRQK